MKIGLVGSSGGHLTQLLAISAWWEHHDRFWVTFEKADAVSRLQNERAYWCHYPTNRNIPNLIKNTFLAICVLLRERPDVIISTGAAVAVPFFWLGRLCGASTVYIEVFDRITMPTLTGKLVYPVTKHFLVQWEELKVFYPKSTLVGSVFGDISGGRDSRAADESSNGEYRAITS